MNIIDQHQIIQRVACYIRVSSQEQKLRGLSPEAQREVLQQYAELHNLKIVEWYEDLGISGRKLIKNRPALQRMIQDAEAGKFDRIIFIKLDRYFRSVAEYYECQKRLDAKNVTWTATEEKYDLTTASGRYWVTQKLAMAEYEADQAGERVDLINEYKVKTGQPLTGSLGFAFTSERQDDGTKKVVKDPARKHIVEDFIQYYLTHQNKGKAHEYINTKYGTDFCYGAFTRLIADTKLYGFYRGNPNYCEAYVTKEEWDKMQEIAANNIKVTATRRIYLFSGLIECPACGHRLGATYSGGEVRTKTNKKTGKVHRWQSREYFYYRCNNRVIERRCTFRNRLSEEKTEQYLLKNFNTIMDAHIEAVKIENAQQSTDCTADRIEELRAEMTRLNKMYKKNRISEDEYDRDFERLEKDLEELETRLTPQKERDLSIYANLLKEDWKTIYNALNRENKRAFWRKYICKITLHEDGSIKEVVFF